MICNEKRGDNCPKFYQVGRCECPDLGMVCGQCFQGHELGGIADKSHIARVWLSSVRLDPIYISVDSHIFMSSSSLKHVII